MSEKNKTPRALVTHMCNHRSILSLAHTYAHVHLGLKKEYEVKHFANIFIGYRDDW